MLEKSVVILVKLFLDGLFFAVSRYLWFIYFIYNTISKPCRDLFWNNDRLTVHYPAYWMAIY